MTTAYCCAACGWEGFGPSYTERKEVTLDAEGGPRVQWWMEPVCPRCYQPVQTVAARSAQELRDVLVGIARLA